MPTLSMGGMESGQHSCPASKDLNPGLLLDVSSGERLAKLQITVTRLLSRALGVVAGSEEELAARRVPLATVRLPLEIALALPRVTSPPLSTVRLTLPVMV